MNIDYKTVIDIGVLAFGAFNAWNSARMRNEIGKLKLWIIQNFQAKPKANFLGEVNDG